MADTSVTPTPTINPTTTVRPSNTSDPVGRLMPSNAQQSFEPQGGEHAQSESDQRRHQPRDAASRTGAKHLAAAGFDDAQKGELACLLADDDREGVEDDKRHPR